MPNNYVLFFTWRYFLRTNIHSTTECLYFYAYDYVHTLWTWERAMALILGQTKIGNPTVAMQLALPQQGQQDQRCQQLSHPQ